MASIHSYKFSIGTSETGGTTWTFLANPEDARGLFPRRAQTEIDTIDGIPMIQFPEDDTRLRSFRFDPLRNIVATQKAFLLGDSESDTDSLLYLKRADSDGVLTIYWLNIPEATLRPYGYRNYEWIPIRVEDILLEPERDMDDVKWGAEMFFRVVPPHQAPYSFTLGFSQLGSLNTLISDEIDSVYFYDANLGTYTDYTSEAHAGGTPFPAATIAAGDKLILSCETTFYGADFEMDTPETVEPDTEQGGVAHAWTAWNGAWTSLPVNDNTHSFTRDGDVNWGTLSGMAAIDLSSAIAGAPATDAMYHTIVTIGTVTTAFKFNKILRA